MKYESLQLRLIEVGTKKAVFNILHRGRATLEEIPLGGVLEIKFYSRAPQYEHEVRDE